MAHRIVDALEVIDIDRYDCKLVAALNEVFHDLGACESVREAREPVLYGLVTYALLILKDSLIGYINDDHRYDGEDIHEQSRKIGSGMP